MDDKKYQKYIYVGEDLDDLTGDGEGEGEEFPPEPCQLTQEMRDRLMKNLIEEGFLEIATVH